VSDHVLGLSRNALGLTGETQFWTRKLTGVIALGVSVGPDGDLTLMDVVGGQVGCFAGPRLPRRYKYVALVGPCMIGLRTTTCKFVHKALTLLNVL
jgi:hypothetical protein